MLRKLKITINVMVIIILSFGSTYALVQPRGSDTAFDLLTWNVKQFPTNGSGTIDTLAILINDLDVDMIAFEEITNIAAFNQLLAQCPGWDGVYSPDNTGLRTALIWRTDRCNVTYIEQLFTNNFYEFPRPPIHFQGSAQYGSEYFDFHIIVFHLKAGSDEASRLRRAAAIVLLKSYLDTNVPSSGEPDWIVLGDWNDEIDDSPSLNVFTPLLEDSTNYTFLTLPLAGDPYWSSFPSWNSLIDHIMITNDALVEYGNGYATTLRLDDEYSNYSYMISDHRPVMAKFESPNSQYEQLLVNGDMETWTAGPAEPPDNWVEDTGNIQAIQEGTIVRNGSYSMNVTWDDGATQRISQTIPITAETAYTCTTWVYDNDPDGRARQYWWWVPTGSAFSDYTVNSTSWQELVVSATAPVGATGLNIQIRGYDTTGWDGNATIYVDDAVCWGPAEGPGNSAPIFTQINRYPWPNIYETDDVNIEARIIDVDGSIASDTLYVQTGAGLIYNPITRDSLVGDSYWYNIGINPVGTVVDYYLVAVDDSGAVTVSDTLSYIVLETGGSSGITIADIQYTTAPGGGGECYPSPYLDSTVTLNGKVTGRFARSDRNDWFFLQDSDSLWSGIYVYDSGTNVNVGDSISITAVVAEYFGSTELATITQLNTYSTGNDIFNPNILTCSDLGSSACDPTAEIYEGMLIRIYNVTIGGDAGYGDTWSNNGSGDSCLIDDDLVYNGPDPFTLIQGQTYYSITGICVYHHDYYRIAPRSSADVVEVGPVGCAYNPGDVNSPDGLGAYNGLDITYGVAFFKGGPAPLYECECTTGNIWFVSGDVNASCTYNGLDITYGVAYFKGGPLPISCADCPPSRQ